MTKFEYTIGAVAAIAVLMVTPASAQERNTHQCRV